MKRRRLLVLSLKRQHSGDLRIPSLVTSRYMVVGILIDDELEFDHLYGSSCPLYLTEPHFPNFCGCVHRLQSLALSLVFSGYVFVLCFCFDPLSTLAKGDGSGVFSATHVHCDAAFPI